MGILGGPLTNLEERVLQAITDLIDQRGYSPTDREITCILGHKSPSTTALYRIRLQDRGLLTWESGKPRTLRVVRHGG